MGNELPGGPTTVYSSANMFRLRRPYGRLSLTIDHRTLMATDQEGREYHLRLGDQPGQVLEMGEWEVIVDSGADRQRLRDCWVAVDVDDQPLLVLYPAADWPDLWTWCQIHGIPRKLRPHDPKDPVAARKLVELSPAEAPLRAGPDTVILEKESAEARDLWRVVSLLLLGPWVVAAWVSLPFAFGISPLLGLLLGMPAVVLYAGGLVTLGLGSRRPIRLDDKQRGELLAARPDDPPSPRRTRSRPPRPRPPTVEESRQLARIRRHARLRPSRAFPIRADAFSRNVSLVLADRTLTVTDDAGVEHRFRLGDGAGMLHGLDLCDWFRKQGGPRTGRYLVGIDTDRTALFAITPLRRFRQTEIETWARLHQLSLTPSPVIYYLDPDADDSVAIDGDDSLAIETPVCIPDTLFIGNRRSGRLRWERTALGWAVVLGWAPVASGVLGLPIWTAPLPAFGLAAHAFYRLRRRLRARRQRIQELNAWQLALTIPDSPAS